MLLYHDLAEIEVGDTPLSPEIPHQRTHEHEVQGAEQLVKHLPSYHAQKYLAIFNEYLEQKTLEAKFCRAIDSLDPMIHELDYRKDWKGWTKEFLLKKKEEHFKPFPLMLATFHELLEYMEQEGYFSQ